MAPHGTASLGASVNNEFAVSNIMYGAVYNEFTLKKLPSGPYSTCGLSALHVRPNTAPPSKDASIYNEFIVNNDPYGYVYTEFTVNAVP